MIDKQSMLISSLNSQVNQGCSKQQKSLHKHSDTNGDTREARHIPHVSSGYL